MKVRLPGGWVDATRRLAFIGGRWVRATRSVVYVDGWKDADRFVTGLSVTVSPGSAYGSAVGSGPLTITTDTVTATPSGGLAPFSYAYTVISGTATILNPAFSSSAFRRAGVAPFAIETATIRITVTDSLGSTATADFTALFEHQGDFS